MTRTYAVRTESGALWEVAGALLAAESSYAHRRQRSRLRWSELELYAETDGHFVLAGIGRSREPGETDRYWALRTLDPTALVRKLMMHEPGKTTAYLPAMSRRLLETAAARDARLVELVASLSGV